MLKLRTLHASVSGYSRTRLRTLFCRIGFTNQAARTLDVPLPRFHEHHERFRTEIDFTVWVVWSVHCATARNHLYRAAEERLIAAAQVLVASCEIKPDAVEWEPEERRLGFGTGIGWMITDPEGKPVDQSTPASELVEASIVMRTSNSFLKELRTESSRMMVLQENLASSEGLPFSPRIGDEKKFFQSLTVTVGLSLEPMQATLNELATVLVAVSVGILLVAAITGRALCRWALRPVIRMADAASSITAADLATRLPTPSTRDELSMLGTAFNGLLSRVEQAYVRQRDFTAEASHQLRTPLTAMMGQVEVALRRDRNTYEYQRVLRSLHGQGDRLRRVVESLLFLARSESDAELLDRKHVELSQWLLEHIRLRWSAHPRFNDIQVETKTLRATVHEVLLGELVDVLLDNALKYSPPATPIYIRVRNEHGAELTVEDTGPGISEVDAQRIFEPFVRADSARHQGVEGFGLGLSVARRIARAHGGDLRLTILKPGSLFTLSLPAA